MGQSDGCNNRMMGAAVLESSAPDMKKIPLEQVEGDIWIVEVLDDLVAFADYRDNSDLADLLRSTRSEVARSLLN